MPTLLDLAFVEVVEQNVVVGRSLIQTRMLVDEMISSPPKPLRAEWGTSDTAQRGMQAALDSAGGPAPLRK